MTKGSRSTDDPAITFYIRHARHPAAESAITAKGAGCGQRGNFDASVTQLLFKIPRNGSREFRGIQGFAPVSHGPGFHASEIQQFLYQTLETAALSDHGLVVTLAALFVHQSPTSEHL